jgi:hypothetical protein
VQFYQHQAQYPDPAHWTLSINNGGSEGDVTFDQAETFIRNSLGEAIPPTWKFAKTVFGQERQSLTMYWTSPDDSLLAITFQTPSADYHPQLLIEVEVVGHCPIACEATSPN